MLKVRRNWSQVGTVYWAGGTWKPNTWNHEKVQPQRTITFSILTLPFGCGWAKNSFTFSSSPQR